MKKLTLIALALATLPGLALSAEPLKFHDDFGAAAKVAMEKKKPVIVVFSASWCPPCQQMKKNVYPSKTVAPFHDQFVWAYLDVDQEKNKGFMQKLGVQGIPHISFISADGKLIDSKVGAASPDQFAGALTTVLKQNKAMVSAQN